MSGWGGNYANQGYGQQQQGQSQQGYSAPVQQQVAPLHLATADMAGFPSLYDLQTLLTEICRSHSVLSSQG